MSNRSILRAERLGITATTFAEFAGEYVKAKSDISPTYAGTLVRRAKKLEQFVGKTALVDVLKEERISGFIRSLVADGSCSAYTVKSYRGDLLTLWRAAADEDLVPYPIGRRIVGLKMPPLIVECYMLHEAESLIAAADDFRGVYDTGVRRALYWGGLIRFAWESGLRRGDCLKFHVDLLRDDGSFRMIQSKTGNVVQRRLRPTTLDIIQQMGRPIPFEWPHNTWTFGGHFKLLRDLAGVNRGTFKWLRRAAGSYAEAETPGAGSKALGHADPSMFRKHYDAQLACNNIPLPPELSDTPERIGGGNASRPARTSVPGRKPIAARVVRIRKPARDA